MNTDKPLKDCFLCCICKDSAGFIPNWAEHTPGGFDDKKNITQPLLCKKCDRAFVHARGSGTVFGQLKLLAWAAKRARDAEHRRMSDKVNLLTWECDKQQRRADRLERLLSSAEELRGKP